MRSQVYGVTVELSTGRWVEYAWASHIRVARWELHIYQGRRQRVYLEAGEWLSYRSFNGHVTTPDARPQVHLRPVAPPAEDQTQLIPQLSLDRGWPAVPRVEP